MPLPNADEKKRQALILRARGAAFPSYRPGCGEQKSPTLVASHRAMLRISASFHGSWPEHGRSRRNRNWARTVGGLLL